MMLMETLRAEVGRIDRAIGELSRKRFAALSRLDSHKARKLGAEIQKLKMEREQLTTGELPLK